MIGQLNRLYLYTVDHIGNGSSSERIIYNLPPQRDTVYTDIVFSPYLHTYFINESTYGVIYIFDAMKEGLAPYWPQIFTSQVRGKNMRMDPEGKTLFINEYGVSIKYSRVEETAPVHISTIELGDDTYINDFIIGNRNFLATLQENGQVSLLRVDVEKEEHHLV